jgi:hypothetical protein
MLSAEEQEPGEMRRAARSDVSNRFQVQGGSYGRLVQESIATSHTRYLYDRHTAQDSNSPPLPDRGGQAYSAAKFVFFLLLYAVGYIGNCERLQFYICYFCGWIVARFNCHSFTAVPLWVFISTSVEVQDYSHKTSSPAGAAPI